MKRKRTLSRLFQFLDYCFYTHRTHVSNALTLEANYFMSTTDEIKTVFTTEIRKHSRLLVLFSQENKTETTKILQMKWNLISLLCLWWLIEAMVLHTIYDFKTKRKNSKIDSNLSHLSSSFRFCSFDDWLECADAYAQCDQRDIFDREKKYLSLSSLRFHFISIWGVKARACPVKTQSN